jgi:hypothetical protein
MLGTYFHAGFFFGHMLSETSVDIQLISPGYLPEDINVRIFSLRSLRYGYLFIGAGRSFDVASTEKPWIQERPSDAESK